MNIRASGTIHGMWLIKMARSSTGSHNSIEFGTLSGLTFSSVSYKHGSAYWVRFDSLTPGTLAHINARFAKKKRLAIETRDLDGFTLLLKGHPMIAGPGALSLAIDGSELQTKSSDTVSLVKGPKGWQVARPGGRSAALTKQAGAEGPIADAAFKPASLRLWHGWITFERGVAAAESSRPASGRMVDPSIEVDVDFPCPCRHRCDGDRLAECESDAVRHEGNELRDREVCGAVALALNAGAADYGLMFVYPVDGRYVVIHSGLPWWTRFDQINRYELAFLNTPAHALTTFGDYVLFRGGLDNVVTEGRFDRKWKLTAEAADKIRATGAVEVR